jgi:hypothetical protein
VVLLYESFPYFDCAIQMRLLLALSVLTALASAHSWVHCTDYEGPAFKSNADYNDGNCKGFPRDYTSNGVFGGDTGFNYQSSGASPVCKTSFNSKSYSKFPMAQYQPGQKVKVVWPAKNHDKGTCTNPFIPDTEMKLYMDCSLSGGRNPSTDAFTTSNKLVIDWKANGGSGFQNCPFFCDNPDKAVCFQEFTVPSNIPSGTVCTFLWYWVFNQGTPAYTSCWEACIGGDCSGNPGTGKPPTNSPPSRTAAPPSRTAAPPSSRPPTTARPPSSDNPGKCRKRWQQCGGKDHSGSTCCESNSKCVFLSEWYSQCWPLQWNEKEILEQSSTTQHNSTMVFIGAAAGSAFIALAAGLVILAVRRRRATRRSAGSPSEVFIPLQ